MSRWQRLGETFLFELIGVGFRKLFSLIDNGSPSDKQKSPCEKQREIDAERAEELERAQIADRVRKASEAAAAQSHNENKSYRGYIEK